MPIVYQACPSENHIILKYKLSFPDLKVHSEKKGFSQKEPQRLLLHAIPCTTILTIWLIELRILIITTIAQMFSLIVLGIFGINNR